MGRVRIAYFIDHLKVGGAQRHLLEVLRRLDRRRFFPQVWTLKGEGELIPQVEELGVTVRSFGLGSRLQEARSLGRLIRAARTLRAERVRIVHCYLSLANVVGALAAALARVPVLLVSKRSLDRYGRWRELWGQRLANRLADRVVANARAVKSFVVREEGCPEDKVVVIPNGIHEDFSRDGCPKGGREALGVKMGGRVVGSVGRLAWKKGYEYFLEAAARVLEEEAGVTFALVGDGPLRPKLEEQARRLGISSRVCFLGQRLDGREVLAALDVFVLSSVIEGMPNALLEALALAKPVVVTDVGGNAEVVTHGKTGLLVPPRQSEELARSILSLLRQRDWARGLGEAGRRDVLERFGFPLVLEALESLYNGLLKEKGL